MEYLSRGGGCTPPQWNIYPEGGVHHLSGIFSPASHFLQCPIFPPRFFFRGGVFPCVAWSPILPNLLFSRWFFFWWVAVWGAGGQEERKGGGGYHTFIRLFLRCVLFYVFDTRCQIRLQTSDFIHIAASRCPGGARGGTEACNSPCSPASRDGESLPGGGRCLRWVCGGQQFPMARSSQPEATGSLAQAAVGAQGGPAGDSSSQQPGLTNLRGRGNVPRRRSVLKEGLRGTRVHFGPGSPA